MIIIPKPSKMCNEGWNYINKGEDYEVTYNRKGKFLGIFKEGGAIKNQYAGRTPEDIWNSLSVEQRQHFLIDHFIEEEDEPQVKYKYLYDEDKEFVDEYSNKEWKKLSGREHYFLCTEKKEVLTSIPFAFMGIILMLLK